MVQTPGGRGHGTNGAPAGGSKREPAESRW